MIRIKNGQPSDLKIKGGDVISAFGFEVSKFILKNHH